MTGIKHLFTDSVRAGGRADAALPWLTAIPLSLCLVLFPQTPLNTSWDASWATVLNQAHESHWQFGTQIVFPYGPLGYLLVPYFWPPEFWSRLLFTGVLNFVASAAVCALAWRLNILWRLLSIGLFALVTANIEYGVADFLLNIGLLCLGLSCLLEEGPRLTISAIILVLLAAVGALAKFSAFVTAVLTIGAVGIDWFLRQRRIAALVLVGGWLLACLSGWMILGQNLSHIATHAARGMTLSGGYERAMGLAASSLVSLGGFTILVLILQLVFLNTSKNATTNDAHEQRHRMLLLGWLSAFLFITWKHGFVRADAHHVVYFVGFAAVLAPLLAILNRSGDERTTGQSVLALTISFLGLLTLQFSLEPRYLDMGKPFLRLAQNMSALLAPDAYFEQMNRALKVQQAGARLPHIVESLGSQPVDVFGNKQAFAALNGLNLQPRPVFQSYAAYNESLMRVNEDYYLSEKVPQFVLFRLDPIDERFPPLEDARLLSVLLFKYEVVGNESSFLLLKARKQAALQSSGENSDRLRVPQLTVLGEGILKPGEHLTLGRFGETNLWLELKVEPTLAGRLRQVVYRPQQPELLVWTDSAESGPKRFRAPAPMLSAGFVASPLLLKTDDFANASNGCGLTQPTAFAVEFEKGGQRWWRSAIRFRVSKMSADFQPSEIAAQVKHETNAEAE